jgi:hypothetical protein
VKKRQGNLVDHYFSFPKRGGEKGSSISCIAVLRVLLR